MHSFYGLKEMQKIFFSTQVFLLTMMLVGILSEPQGPAYLPPTGTRPATGGHPDEWVGVSTFFSFIFCHSYYANKIMNMLLS